MEAARKVFDSGNDELEKYRGKYLVAMKSSRLVKLINSARNDNKQWMLQVILAHADQLLIDNLFAKLNIPSHLLRDVANSADLACIPQRFIYLLGRITDKEDQEWAVEKGVGALFNRGKTECLIPLVSALCECPLSGMWIMFQSVKVSILPLTARLKENHLSNATLTILQSLHKTTPMLYTLLVKIMVKLMSSLNGCWIGQIVET